MQDEPIKQILLSATLIISFVVIAVFVVLSVILNHHWVSYGVSQKNIIKVRLWYFGISFILFFTMAMALVKIIND